MKEFLPFASLFSGWSYQITLSGSTQLSLNTFTEANEGQNSHTNFFTDWVSEIPIATTGLAAATHSVFDLLVQGLSLLAVLFEPLSLIKKTTSPTKKSIKVGYKRLGIYKSTKDKLQTMFEIHNRFEKQ